MKIRSTIAKLAVAAAVSAVPAGVATATAQASPIPASTKVAAPAQPQVKKKFDGSIDCVKWAGPWASWQTIDSCVARNIKGCKDSGGSAENPSYGKVECWK